MEVLGRERCRCVFLCVFFFKKCFFVLLFLVTWFVFLFVRGVLVDNCVLRSFCDFVGCYVLYVFCVFKC